MDNEEEKLALFGDKKIPNRILFKRIFQYIKPHAWKFILALLLIVVSVVFDMIFPLIISKITDNLQSSLISMKTILMLAFGYLGLGIVNLIVTYFESMLLQRAGQDIIYTLRTDVFAHIENMSQNQFNMMPVGSLVTRVANYTTTMSDLFTNVLVNILRNVLSVVVVYIVMLTISWKLSLILLGFMVVIFIISFFFSRIVYRVFKKEREDTSRLNTFLNESLSGMKIIQYFNQQVRKENEFKKINNDLKRDRYNVILAFGVYRPLISLLYFLAIAVTFWFGSKNLSAGEVVAFYLYMSKFFNPVQELADKLNHIQRAKTASERLFNLMDVPPEVMDKEGAKNIDNFKGKIEFKHVWFAYIPGEWVLKDVSFTINPGETAAFVGATGSGKTTILSLIVRNYEIQKGQILIDDIDIKDIQIDSLRRAIGQMLQDVFLFTGSIKDNITLHDENFSKEEIEEACRYVNADKFIEKLDNGLEEQVVERGENFSQGQRQLLSFARTILHKPQILILDEATANIDTETESLIQESLEKMKSIGTMLVVAHRLSTIQKSDKIIVLAHGEIIESGNHQQLLKNKGYYYRLYKLQYEEQ
ncbi:MAG: ABC transporter ATP-binding protein/permease [Bacilli bacterium]|nr:ABC transporter ATP-binding protein/permease [Bacilli bacterium]